MEKLGREEGGWRRQGAQFITEISTFFLKGPESKYFRICGPWRFFHNHSHLQCSMKAASHETGKSGSGHLPIKLYLKTGCAHPLL